MIELNEFNNMDNMEGLTQLKDNSIDCMVTDPPYGYFFMGKDWDKVLPPMDTWKECLRVMKPGAFAFVMSAPRQDVLSRMMVNLEDAGFNTGFTSIYWTYATGFPKAGNVGKMVDKRLGVQGEKYIDEDFLRRNPSPNNDGVYDSGLNDGIIGAERFKPSSTEAKSLDGSYTGFQPKPAVEVIIVAMKPLSESTYIDQALNNGKGVTWLDDCRVPYQSDGDKWNEMKVKGSNGGEAYGDYNTDGLTQPNQSGRFPANLLVSDDMFGNEFSRFFDLDAWAQKTFPFIIVPKASSDEKNEGTDNIEGTVRFSSKSESGQMMPSKSSESHIVTGNFHPTVKPIKLMAYLITLGSRPGDIILDPYAGSGTTGLAAKTLDRNFICFELSEEYNNIAVARFEHKENKKQKTFDQW